MNVVTAEILRQYFLSIVGEMDEMVSRSSMSPIFNEGHDYTTGLFSLRDSEVDLIALGTGVPVHLFAATTSVERFMTEFRKGLCDGDIGLINDPYHGGGHLPDWTLIKPIFVDGKPRFCSVVRAHMLDPGGPYPGGRNPNATEIWQEGFRIYPLKIVEAGQVRDDVWQLLLANSRLPDYLDNDLKGMIGACEAAATRIHSIVEKYGLAEVEESVGYTLSYSEKWIRKEIEQWPEGQYRGESYADSDFIDTRDIKIRVTLTVRNDGVTLDFAGTDSQVKGCINSTHANALAYALLPLMTVCPEIPVNSGLFRPFRVSLPQGTVVNANAPAAVALSTVCVGHEICEAVLGALEKVVPERVATASIDMCFLYTWGKDPRYDEFFLSTDYYASAVSAGGTFGQDGWGALAATMNGLRLPTFEMSEIQYPFFYLKGEYATDTAAPGRWRGVPAFHLRRRITAVEEPVSMTMFVRSSRHPCRGFAGGKPGKGNRYVSKPGTLKESVVIERLDQISVDSGEEVVCEKGGGGGWGDALHRDPELVLRDVLDEIVSVRGAADDYGVAIDLANGCVDQGETERLRQARK